jgi:aminopeptidase N
MMKNKLFVLFTCWFALPSAHCQRDFFKDKKQFTLADTLRGALSPARTCYDVTFYDLQLKIDVAKRTIAGFNEMTFNTLTTVDSLQLDLFANMKIDKVLFEQKSLKFKRLYNTFWVYFDKTIPKNTKGKLKIEYHGMPQIAKNAPWDGGFTWKKDAAGKTWMGVSCEGIGASLWWPNKDHLSDEPDSMAISVSVPSGLMAVSNGNLRQVTDDTLGYKKYEWFVSYPINNYNVTLNVANYNHFDDIYTSKDGSKLSLDYYVLQENVEKAKKQFQQTKPMLACYEKYLGKYPFWKDGYALVETPFLGMEHQSAIAYGNQYMRGYLGGMIPPDMNWDYIIVHESGHEYWGNAVSCKDHTDMWIHEGFTTYLESLYVEETMSYKDAIRYLMNQRQMIEGTQPLIGPYDVNFNPTSDIYFKGTWMIHTLRHAIGDDPLFFDMFKALYNQFAYKTTTSDEVTQFISTYLKKDYSKFFEQYLYHVQIPVLEYKLKKTWRGLDVSYRWATDVKGFEMPIRFGKSDAYQTVLATNEWSKVTLRGVKTDDFKVATELFYVNTSKIE